MNERIKRLIDEAVKFRLDPDSNDYETQVSPEDLEVFAELIIQECLLAISKTPVEDNEIPTMVKCHDQVEKHFGVEE